MKGKWEKLRKRRNKDEALHTFLHKMPNFLLGLNILKFSGFEGLDYHETAVA